MRVLGFCGLGFFEFYGRFSGLGFRMYGFRGSGRRIYGLIVLKDHGCIELVDGGGYCNDF